VESGREPGITGGGGEGDKITRWRWVKETFE
jgi:hypothetical protein